MTRKEIAFIVREFFGALLKTSSDLDKFERFAALVAEREREECAKLCDAETKKAKRKTQKSMSCNGTGFEYFASAEDCAKAIRARKEGA